MIKKTLSVSFPEITFTQEEHNEFEDIYTISTTEEDKTYTIKKVFPNDLPPALLGRIIQESYKNFLQHLTVNTLKKLI